MFLKAGVGVEFYPIESFAPAGLVCNLLRQWHNADFEKDKCVQLLKTYIKLFNLPKKNGLTERMFDSDSSICNRNYFYAKPPKEWYFGFRTHNGQARHADIGTYVGLKDVSELASTIRRFLLTRNRKELRNNMSFFSRSTFDEIFKMNVAGRNKIQLWPDTLKAGIYRREHASILVSSKTTQVIIDPIFLSPSSSFPEIPWQRPNSTRGLSPDAVLITHFHKDHWHAPSALCSAFNSHCNVFVPEVPKASHLSPRLDDQLKLLKVPSASKKWGETFFVGDIEIDVLPLFGQQVASNLSPFDPNLRRWGNSYRITTPQFSALILGDTGSDPLGNMLNVVKKSTEDRGPVDMLLAPMKEYNTPHYPDGLGGNLYSLSFDQLKTLSMKAKAPRDPTLAKMCKLTKARYFLPFAQGFSGYGNPVIGDPWGEHLISEKSAVRNLSRKFKSLGLKTSVISWNPGDHFSLEGKQRAKK